MPDGNTHTRTRKQRSKRAGRWPAPEDGHGLDPAVGTNIIHWLSQFAK